jgi:hypothetical protein
MQCNLSKANRRFGGTCRLHLQGRRISRARSQRESRWQAEPPEQSRACHLFSPGFLALLIFDPEDGGDMFFRNVGWLSTDYTALIYLICIIEFQPFLILLSRLFQAITFQTCIQEVSGSNVGRHTDHPDWGVCVFTQSLQADPRIVPQTKSRPFIFTSFLNNHALLSIYNSSWRRPLFLWTVRTPISLPPPENTT